mmetsp:Transcript_132840/g.331433  ORF Transcript_132840/g.331433 Transcript_132840/m.331433 type:complete len:85 (-) Transcript_132840:37-291(-)
MNKLAKEYDGKATFLCINTRGIPDAKSYKESKGLNEPALLHGAVRPPEEYGLRYIPHKVVIDKGGKVVKNFEGVNLAEDVKAVV